jgi:lipoprotein-releasing system permease protein
MPRPDQDERSGASRSEPRGERERATLTRWPLVRTMARRLALREVAASRRTKRVCWVSLLVLTLAFALQLSGVSHLLVVAVIGVSSMVALGSICVWLFPPAMAVSVLGVALACASLTTALSVTSGFEREITRAMARFNGHVLITKYGLDFYEYDEVADRWRGDARVRAASPFAYSMVAVVSNPSEQDEEASAVPVDEDPDVHDDETGAAQLPPLILVAKGLDPKRARELDGLAEIMGSGELSGLRPGDVAHLPGLVLGEPILSMLDVQIGDEVRIVVPAENDGRSSLEAKPPRHARFEVLDSFKTGTSELDRNLVLMHITAAQALFFGQGRVTGIELELRDPDLAQDVADDIMASGHRFLRTSTWRDTSSSLLIGLRQIRATISIILGLMVLVAASSLIASLLLIVRRKRHDIAVLMAVGSDGALVFWVFEAVGVLAGISGAFLGLMLGALYCTVIGAYHFPLGADIYPVDHLPVVVRPIDALGPAVVAVALCALASGPVAAMAARVRVIDSLRR